MKQASHAKDQMFGAITHKMEKQMSYILTFFCGAAAAGIGIAALLFSTGAFTVALGH